VTITLHGIGGDGKTVPGSQLATWSNAINLASGKTARFSVSPSGAVTAKVAPGNYDLTTNIFTAAGSRPASVTLADDTHLSARHNVTVTFDARKAALLSAKVDRHVDDANVYASLLEKVHGRTFYFEAVSFFNSFQVYALPTPRVTGRPYRFLGQVDLDNGTPDPQKVGNATVTYALRFPSAGRIPAKLSVRVHDGSLAKVRETFREQDKRSTFVDMQHIPLALENAGFIAGSEFYLPAAGQVTQLMSPGQWGPDAGYIGGTQPDRLFPEDREVGPARTLRAGHTYHDTFGSAALGAASLTSRLGNVISGEVLLDSTSAAGHDNEAFAPATGLTGNITLRRGSKKIGTGMIFPVQRQPTFTVAAGTGRYTLSAVLHRHVAWSTLGTTARESWTFRSGHVAGHTPRRLPLWDIRIRGAFDSLDRAPAGHPFSLTVAPDLPAGAPAARITSVTVRASFNDGKTWRRLSLRRHGKGHWTTTVMPPRGGKFVSLSARLTDSAGNTTQQTVIRAYRLRPPAR
jgi:hypothetical protein